MVQVTISLPDDLAQDAQEAGLLASDALAALLREQLLRRQDVGERLRDLWARTPVDAITPEIEQEIVALVKADRAERAAGQPR